MRIALIGYGNVGRAVLSSARQAGDVEVAGIVRRRPEAVAGYKVVRDIAELGPVDVALLTVPSRSVPAAAEALLRAGVSTVDSFDIHGEIPAVRARLHAAATAGGAVSVLSAGWDPGSDSVIRALLLACAPQGITHTNFGPGMSMGHSVAARAIAGVKDALSMTIPAGESRHRRQVYVELTGSVAFEDVARAVKADPYFVHDETHVLEVESVAALRDMGHGVTLTRHGVSGDANNQGFPISMRIENPALTGQVMLSCARAATRQRPGCYTMIELPMVDLLPGDREGHIARLV
ncbi:MAG: diaminopimelate dehydrogenase [Christensenellaceae bacterium]|nr:diaminopimelate dehydrogenase [Christensenellaceae bacterium]